MFLYTIHIGVEVVIAAVILYGAKTGDLFAFCWSPATGLLTEDSMLLDSDAGSEFEPER